MRVVLHRIALGRYGPRRAPCTCPRRRQRVAVRRRPPSRTAPVTITWSPPSSTSRSSQPTHTSVPSSAGMPSALRPRDAVPLLAHLGLGRERAREVRLAGGEHVDAEAARGSTARSVREPRSRQASISGGSSDSERRRWRSAPTGPSGPSAVTTVTAVGKCRHRGGRRRATRSLAGGPRGRLRLSRSHPADTYDAARVRPVLALIPVAAALCVRRLRHRGHLGARGRPRPTRARCCSRSAARAATRLTPAGTQGSGNRALRNQGPNFDQRADQLRGRAVRDPQRRLLGRDHAPEHRRRRRRRSRSREFLAEWSGSDVEEPPQPRRGRRARHSPRPRGDHRGGRACST